MLLLWLPFSTSKAACIAAISDRRVLSSANAASMSGDPPRDKDQALAKSPGDVAMGWHAARADLLATAILGSADERAVTS